ncbi:flagellar basal body protein FliL [Zhengella mangrovi]|uniref:Flagellar protein FliL n=1 Tax=Zhengella mangrovi TaxID=1982044 RepID=A0A2G1QJP0_9HYPH|nr:flagellar basal body-associated FliL family protein [Zhengella mangrovi]PHP65745.1 flagellar basal body protein FliL [Zhengella mangrovi]
MNAEAEEAEKPSVIMGLVVPLLAIVLVGGGAGWGLGTFVLAPNVPAPVAEAAAPAGHGEEKAGGHDAKPAEGEGHAAETGGVKIVDLDPIVTNVAVPSETWMRLELALVLDEPLDINVEKYIQQDLFAFARTVHLAYVDTPTGYLQFRNELTDRARMRAGPGKVRQVMVKAMLFE